jgi:acetyl esterase/lipase
MKRSLSILVAAILCLPPLYGQNAVKGYHAEKNIQYRGVTEEHYTDSICRLDLYHPAGKTGYPTVVWFHGGSLTGGRRSAPEQLLDNGFALATVDYRLSPNVTVPEIIDDAAAACAWVAGNIEKYGGDPSKIYLAGHSAGGYLVFMIGLDKRYLAKYGIDPDGTFAALIPYSGQVITHATSRRERGITVATIVDEMAPLYHVRPDCLPVIMITGDRELEMAGRYEETAYMWRMFRLAGHPHAKFYELDGFTHGGMADPGHYITIKYIKEQEKIAAKRDNGKKKE